MLFIGFYESVNKIACEMFSIVNLDIHLTHFWNIVRIKQNTVLKETNLLIQHEQNTNSTVIA